MSVTKTANMFKKKDLKKGGEETVSYVRTSSEQGGAALIAHLSLLLGPEGPIATSSS